MDRKCGSAFESFTVFKRIWKTSLKSVKKGERLRKAYIQKPCLTGGLPYSWQKSRDATSILTATSPVNISPNFKLHKLPQGKGPVGWVVSYTDVEDSQYLAWKRSRRWKRKGNCTQSLMSNSSMEPNYSLCRSQGQSRKQITSPPPTYAYSPKTSSIPQ